MAVVFDQQQQQQQQQQQHQQQPPPYTQTFASTAKDAETPDRRYVRRIAAALKILAENAEVKTPWRPFMAACEAVYPFINPVVFARSVGDRACWRERFKHNRADAKEDAAVRGMLVEVAAVGAGAVRCAAELRSRFCDLASQARVRPYAQLLSFRRSTVGVYGTLEALFDRYDALAAQPCQDGPNLYRYYNCDPHAVFVVMRRCRLSNGAMHGALRMSLLHGDGVFARCLRWVEGCPSAKDAHERVAAGQMINCLVDNAGEYCEIAADAGSCDDLRAIAESPLMDDCCRMPAREALFNHAVHYLDCCGEDPSPDKCDQILCALDAATKIPRERVYECAAECYMFEHYAMMRKLIDLLHSLGGVREFKDVDRDRVASVLARDSLGWEIPPYRPTCVGLGLAADLVRQLCVGPLTGTELRVLELGGGSGSDGSDDASRKRPAGDEIVDDARLGEGGGAAEPDVKRRKIDSPRGA